MAPKPTPHCSKNQRRVISFGSRPRERWHWQFIATELNIPVRKLTSSGKLFVLCRRSFRPLDLGASRDIQSASLHNPATPLSRLANPFDGPSPLSYRPACGPCGTGNQALSHEHGESSLFRVV